MKLKSCFVLSLIAVVGTLCAQSQNDGPMMASSSGKAVPGYFTTRLEKGQKLGNIFSRTISISGTDFPEIVSRVSGTGIYTVTGVDAGTLYFDGSFRYDGRPASNGKVSITDQGKTQTYNGTQSTNTDGSGLLFNALIWGNPPEELRAGTSWEVKIGQPWELGGPGTQTVSVLEVDPVNHSVKLKREGWSDGYFDNDIREWPVTTKDGKKTPMKLTPGNCHWVGYTVFKEGLVISDELMVTRPVTLTAEGLEFKAEQREYILLNAMPAEN